MKHLFVLVIAIITLSCGSLHAQQDSTRTDSTEHSESGFVAAPFAKYSPETGIAGGAAGLFYFTIHNDSSSKNRPSSISAGITYTQKKQFYFGTDYGLNFSNDKYYIFGGFDYKRYPFDFFGVGNYNPKDPIDIYTPLWRGGDVLITRNFMKSDTGTGLNAGLGIEARYDLILSSTPGGILETGNVPGSRGGLSAGIGWIINFDNRDNVFSTQSGYYADLRTYYYSKAIGASFNFDRTTLDLRHFLAVFGTHTLAMQCIVTLVTGIEPFYTMAELGGDVNMRGYYEGRFRDRDAGVFQAEYRMPVFWRFGIVGFADIGEVGETVRDFKYSGIKFSCGTGIRFFVSQSERVVARLDYGIGNNSQELYFSVNEAF